jgi:hypothetical protein
MPKQDPRLDPQTVSRFRGCRKRTRFSFPKPSNPIADAFPYSMYLAPSSRTAIFTARRNVPLRISDFLRARSPRHRVCWSYGKIPGFDSAGNRNSRSSISVFRLNTPNCALFLPFASRAANCARRGEGILQNGFQSQRVYWSLSRAINEGGS